MGSMQGSADELRPWDERFPPLDKVPAHIGIIMDGNGRWAKQQGKPRSAGHRAGVENIRRVLEACVRFGVQVLTIYAFSTENWDRPRAEVNALMGLLAQALRREVPELHKNGVRLRHLGRLDRLPERLQREVLDAIELTKGNDRLTLNVAFSYGGRAEIVDAVKRIIQANTPLESVNEDLISQHLYTAGQPDPDMIIRTGGEFRLSNFLLWQAWYAEYYSTPVYWPDFDEAELYKALQIFSQRKRRYGLVPVDQEAVDQGTQRPVQAGPTRGR
jgi:undecaprenyl diphosphate synthase